MAVMTIHVKEATSATSIQEIEGLLLKMDEIERALVDVEEGGIKITFDENQVDEDQIIKRIQLEGFHIE
ncbi:metal ABC transporter ATPase [Planococcus glaciei]|uniref:heavy-metal-associated domain-containing protein n=1 Tax=Planococcus glaciei TaxID=459472 RepID=UPI00069D8F39|nr:cation transporter [Planococcus glaciei]KOF12067.1 metal ABC transporter ATPase [Planococcus glaciei]